MKDKKIVFFQGAFDFINAAHIRCFKKAKAKGDILVVGINTNSFYKEYKKKEPILPYSEKKEIVESIKYVDRVVPCRNWFDTARYLKDFDVYIVGSEWVKAHKPEIDYMKSNNKEVVVLERDKKVVHSSLIKEKIIGGLKKWGKI